jgi:hypothetical protein
MKKLFAQLALGPEMKEKLASRIARHKEHQQGRRSSFSSSQQQTALPARITSSLYNNALLSLYFLLSPLGL